MVPELVIILKKRRKNMTRNFLYENKIYLVKIAENDAEKGEVYKLRYKIFHDELKELPWNKEQIDKDGYDNNCEHLILRDKKTNEVIGTYRILPWFNANQQKGYYSKQEFQLINIPRERIAELGRLCIKKGYRETNCFITLWLGLYRYAKSRKIRYFFGVTSLHKDTPLENVKKIYCYLKKHNKISKKFHAKPLVPVPNLTMSRHSIPKKEFKNMVPKMVNNYMRIGTSFIGEPSYDDVFKVYDLLTIFDITTFKIKSVNSILTLKNYLKTLFSKS